MTAPRSLGRRAALAATALAAACALGAPSPAPAQEGGAGLSPADSAAVAQALAASDSAAATAARRAAQAEPDRFEFGVAAPQEYFDWLGTFAYRRRVATDPRFAHVVHIELAGGHKRYLTEGAASGYWLVRPLHVLNREGRIRPIIEGGFGLHLVVQFADIVQFDDWSSHARAFAKGHGIGGVEADLSDRWGVALRGRITIPSHRPLDYAQLVFFLR